MKARDALEGEMPVSPIRPGNELPGDETLLPRVVEIVRALALETGGPRAAQAATPEASLERDVGLGSLERRLRGWTARRMPQPCTRHSGPGPTPSLSGLTSSCARTEAGGQVVGRTRAASRASWLPA
jgi:hypothetical protein